MSATAGTRLIADRYRLGDELGRGGTGIVWRGRDVVLDRDVAVKEVVVPTSLPDAERQARHSRALREARAAARLTHPSVASVYDVVSAGDALYLVLELVDGPSLDRRVATSGPLPVPRAAALGLELLGALEAAHAHGIVHRDVKPSNVLMPPRGPAKLTDFGTAAVIGDPALTATGTVLGTPSYMAPEQTIRSDVGPEADLWGLGATLYHAVEGRPPYDRGQPLPTVVAVLHEAPDPLLRAGELGPVILDLLEKDPHRRLRPDELRDRLRRLVPETVVLPAPVRAEAASAPTATIAAPPVHAAPATPDPPGPLAPVDAGEEWGESLPSPGHAAARLAGVLLGVAALLAVATWLFTRPAPPSPAVAADATAGAGDALGTPAAVDTAPPSAPAASATGPATADATAGESSATPDTSAQPVAPAAPPADAPSADTDVTPVEAPDAEVDAPAEVEAPAEGDARPAGTAELPEGWTALEIGPPGATVGYPADWRVVRVDRTRTDVRAPGGGRYLRTDWTATPPDDPVADWQQQSQSFAGRHSGYEEISIERVSLRERGGSRGSPPPDWDAALWEYRYTVDGVELRALNLGIDTGPYGYALNLVGRESDWDEVEPMLDEFLATFTPAPGPAE